MPIIAYVGDIHGDIDGMYKFLLEWQERTTTTIDAVVHVGDFGIYLPPKEFWSSPLAPTQFMHYWDGYKVAPIPTFVCPGNHEEYSVTQWWLKQPNRMKGLHIMRDGEITDVLGLKHGAIWGNFSFKTWNNPQRALDDRRNYPRSPKAMHITQEPVERLKAAGEFDVLITHDAPAGLMKPMKQPDKWIKQVLGLDDDEKAHGCPGFNEIYLTGKPKFHFFGHFHTYYVCQHSDPLVVCLHCFNYNKEKSLWVVDFNEWGDVDSRKVEERIYF